GTLLIDGKVKLTGANTYSGGTAISRNGVLSVSGSGNVGTGTVTMTGGTLQSTAPGTFTNAFTLNAPGGTIDTNGFDTTVSGAIGSVGALTKAGAGKLTLSGTNTYSGGTAVNGGVVEVDSFARLGTGGVSFDGGTLRLTTGDSTARAVTLNA